MMLDRGIGIAGLALALIFGVLPYFVPKLPHWISITGIGAGILLLGLSAGLVIADRRNVQAIRGPVDTASLRLHIYSDNRMPERLAVENIFRWYYLRNIVLLQGTDGRQHQVVITNLFVTFDPEVRVTTIQVRSPDMQLPPYDVKEFNQRYAIIVLSGEIGEGTLEVAVIP
jgi:hypothetical protein